MDRYLYYLKHKNDPEFQKKINKIANYKREVYYFDENKNPCDKEHASTFNVLTFDENGNFIKEEFFETIKDDSKLR